MNNCLLLSIFLLALLGCQSKEESITPAQFVGKWQLYKYESSPESATPGKMNQVESLGYEMYYEFTADSTFIKRRSTGLQTGGTYSIQFFNGAYYANLQYQEETDQAKQSLQHSCGSGRLALKLVDKNQLVEDDRGCDGTMDFYKRIE